MSIVRFIVYYFLLYIHCFQEKLIGETLHIFRIPCILVYLFLVSVSVISLVSLFLSSKITFSQIFKIYFNLDLILENHLLYIDCDLAFRLIIFTSAKTLLLWTFWFFLSLTFLFMDVLLFLDFDENPSTFLVTVSYLCECVHIMYYMWK